MRNFKTLMMLVSITSGVFAQTPYYNFNPQASFNYANSTPRVYNVTYPPANPYVVPMIGNGVSTVGAIGKTVASGGEAYLGGLGVVAGGGSLLSVGGVVVAGHGVSGVAEGLRSTYQYGRSTIQSYQQVQNYTPPPAPPPPFPSYINAGTFPVSSVTRQNIFFGRGRGW